MIYIGLCRLCRKCYLFTSNEKKVILRLCKECQPPKLFRV